MSLRDQLIAKGLVSKKRARKIDQQARREKKKAQSQQRKKSVVREETERKEAEARAAEQARRLEERRARDAERDRYERALQVRQIIEAHRLRGDGPVPFHHRTLHGTRLGRMSVSRAMGERLRRGDAGIVALQLGNRVDYVVVSQRAATRLLTLRPEVVVHFTQDTAGISAPDHALAHRDWEPDLLARRARTDSNPG